MSNVYNELLLALREQVIKWRSQCLDLEQKLFSLCSEKDKLSIENLKLENEIIDLKKKLKGQE